MLKPKAEDASPSEVAECNFTPSEVHALEDKHHRRPFSSLDSFWRFSGFEGLCPLGFRVERTRALALALEFVVSCM